MGHWIWHSRRRTRCAALFFAPTRLGAEASFELNLRASGSRSSTRLAVEHHTDSIALQEHEYEIVYSSSWGGPGYPTDCAFTTTTTIPLPDPSLLRVYHLLFLCLHSSEEATALLHPAIDYNPLEELEGLPHKGTGGEAVLGVALLKQILSSEAEKRASEFGREV